jgi:hypothetical protein
MLLVSFVFSKTSVILGFIASLLFCVYFQEKVSSDKCWLHSFFAVNMFVGSYNSSYIRKYDKLFRMKAYIKKPLKTIQKHFSSMMKLFTCR